MASPIRGKEKTPLRVECSENHEEKTKWVGKPEVTDAGDVNILFPLTGKPFHSEGLHEPGWVLYFRMY